MESRIVKVNDVHLEFFTFGSGHETLILAAGNGRHASDLNELADGVAREGNHVITFNYRGIGLSEGPIFNLEIPAWRHSILFCQLIKLLWSTWHRQNRLENLINRLNLLLKTS
jgi:alpha-beta hydrolase superfamily lysophospholipase